MSENTTKKITKAQRFADIRAMLTGEDEVKYGTTVQIAVEFIDHEVELLARKNTTGGERKPTEAQKQNIAYKAQIVDFLIGRNSNEGMTCTAIGKAIPALAEFGTSKYSALCNQLVEEGKLTKATVKGKTLFSLAV